MVESEFKRKELNWRVLVKRKVIVALIFIFQLLKRLWCTRGIAQWLSASVLGTEGRAFESHYPEKKNSMKEVAERSKAVDCKSIDVCLRRFKSGLL